MAEHLLLVTLGPIQDFIAAARRTRDLWFGSHLLSELSRAAAKELAARGQLVFPALDHGDPQLQPCNQPLRPGTNQMPLSIANKLLVVLPASVDPVDAAKAARSAAQQRLEELATTARREAAALLADDIDAVWDEQLATALEFCAGWAPLDGPYAAVRQDLEAALAGRKNLREFMPWRQSRPGAPKSSLDGARETVLREPTRRSAALVRRYRVASTEQLDAIGVLKRCGGEPEQFVPIRSVTLADWFQLADRGLVRKVEEACDRLGRLTKVRGISGGHFFRYDADVFFRDRWPAIEQELDLSADREAWAAVQAAVRAALKDPPEPSPYVACLVADGDRMGVALNRLTSPATHRSFSQQLAQFPDQARQIVEDELGALVYAGGDDVLAFLPTSRAVACATRLSEAFAKLLGDQNPEQPPTLSVGLGIGHSLTGMGDLLDLGRRAEKLAKRARNSLAVMVQKRSGGEDQWTAPWSGGPPNAADLAAAQALAGRLPGKKVAQVRDLLRRAPRPSEPEPKSWGQTLTLEVERILARTAGGDQKLTPEEVGLRWPVSAAYAELHQVVDAWVGLQRIAMVMSRTEGER